MSDMTPFVTILVPSMLGVTLTSLLISSTQGLGCGCEGGKPENGVETQGCQIWYPNWVKLALNGRNVGLFKISLSTFCYASQNALKLIFKNPRLDPFGTNLTLFGCQI